MPMSGAGFGEPSPADVLLAEHLDQAVPTLLGQLAEMPADARTRQIDQWRDGAAQHIAERGDTVRYGGPNIAGTFTVLARSLAVLAHAPGGITAFGRHWCTNHRLCVRAAGIAQAA